MMSSTGSRKKQRTSKALPAAAAAAAINGLDMIPILNRALEWLHPQDVCRSSRVCRDWRHAITQHTWKQAAANTKPAAALALERALGQGGSGRRNLDQKAIAKGFVRIQRGSPNEGGYGITFPEATIQPEDLYLLIEVKAFGTTVAWCKNLSECIQTFNPRGLPMVEFDDFSSVELKMPAAQFPRELFSTTLIDMSLWRADTGQSICLGQDVPENFDGDDAIRPERSCYFIPHEYIYPTSENTKAGLIARELCRARECHRLETYAHLYATPKLSRGEDKAVDQDTTGMTILISPKSSNNSICSEFQISKLFVEFRFCMRGDDCSNDNLGSVNDFLLFLEGLHWK